MLTGQIIPVRVVSDRGNNPRTGHEWRCSCGRTNLFTGASSRSIAEGDLDHHLINAHANRPPAGVRTADAIDSGVPDAIPDDNATHDVQHDIPINQGIPEQRPSHCPIAFIDTNNVLIVKEGRWKLFTDDELILLGENLNAEWESETEDTRLGHFNPQIVALLEPIVLGINEELIERDLPPRT